MRNVTTFWGVGEATLRALVESQFRRKGLVVRYPQPVALSGDALIPEADQVFDTAVEIAAPPERVWPWLAQMYRGGGIYGPAALESARCRSAEYLMNGASVPEAGDRLDAGLRLAAITPGREIVWESVEPLRVLGFTIPHFTMNYRLQEAGPGGTRLLARIRGTCPGITGQVADYLFGVLEFLLTGSQLLRIKALAESPDRPAGAAIPRPARHQAPAFIPAPARSVAV